MLNELLYAGSGLAIGATVSYILSKKLSSSASVALIEQAKAKARVIEHEAEIKLHNAQVKAKEKELELKEKYEQKEEALLNDYNKKFEELQKKDKELNEIFKDELKSITLEKEELKKQQKLLDLAKKEVETEKELYNKKIAEADKLIERASGMTKAEAKEIVLKRVEEENHAEIAHIVRKYETIAKRDAKKKCKLYTCSSNY